MPLYVNAKIDPRKGGTPRGGVRTGLAAGLVLLAILFLVVFLEPSRFFEPLRDPFGTRERPVARVILIIVDTLRPDALSCYRPETFPTPHIDRLARDGVRFTNAFSTAPWTLPAVSSIMTGLSPMVHHAVRPDSRLPGSIDTLAEYMRDAGYLTAAIGSNIFLKPDYNLSQGFREYDFYPKTSRGGPPLESGEGKTRSELQSTESGEGPSSDDLPIDISTADLTKKVIAWLRAHHQNDFFLWVHYFDPHLPYEPVQDLLPVERAPERIGASFGRIDEIRSGKLDLTAREKEWIRELYTREVLYIDENIGVLIQALERLDIYEDALILFMSDHGEEFWEHGGFEHGHTLYNELLRVPLIIKLPGAVSRGESASMVCIQGIMPTILDLCGIDHEEELDVHSLAPMLEGRDAGTVTPPIVSMGLLYGEEKESVIMEGMKYIRVPGTNRDELYLLGNDSGERISVVPSSPDLVLRAAKVLDDQREDAEIARTRYGVMEEETVDIDPGTREWLESLGYLR